MELHKENTVIKQSLTKSSKNNEKLNSLLKNQIAELAKVKSEHVETKKELELAYKKAASYEQTINEHESARVKLEQNINKLLDIQAAGIDDCNSEIDALCKLTDSLKQIISSNINSENNQTILSIYTVLISFRERMKLKVSSLSENTKSIVEGFVELNQNHMIITDALKKRADDVLSNYKSVSSKIENIIKRLDEQSSMLGEITKENIFSNCDKTNKKPNISNPRNVINVSNIRDSASNPQVAKEVMLDDIAKYSKSVSSQWFLIFRLGYKKQKCANMFYAILKDESLIFEHKLIILNKLITEIKNDASLQQYYTGSFHNVIDRITKKYENTVTDEIKAKTLNSYKIETMRFKYSEDLKKEVNTNFFSDYLYGSKKYVKRSC